MSQRRYTSDELYLLRMHAAAVQSGNVYSPVDRYQIGRTVGLHGRGTDALVRHLLQANFVVKGEGNALCFTAHGVRLVQDLDAAS